MNTFLLRTIAHGIVSNPIFEPRVHPETSQPLTAHIKARWLQSFMDDMNIVVRTQTGKLSLSPKKKEVIYREFSFHLGNIKRELYRGALKA